MRQANPARRSWLSDEGGFVGHRLSMLVSPAWQARSVPLAKVLERLEIEHLRHGGRENGNLSVTYDQFQDAGVSRKSIHPALALGADLGLLEVIQHSEWVGNIRDRNTYRVTYVPGKDKRAPTDEWQSVTEEQAAAALARYRASVKRTRGEAVEAEVLAA